MNPLIQQIKNLRNELGQRFDPDKLVQLYRAIDKLYEEYKEGLPGAGVLTDDPIKAALAHELNTVRPLRVPPTRWHT